MGVVDGRVWLMGMDGMECAMIGWRGVCGVSVKQG